MSTRDKVLDIFSRVREDKALPWDEDHFMEFLVRPNGGTIDNSFKGRRYKNKFLEQIQMEFAICFPNAFYERHWGFSKFVAYIEHRQKKVSVNLKLARRRFEDSKSYFDIFNPIVLINLVLIPPYFLFPPPYGWPYLTVPLALNLWVIRAKMADTGFNKRLFARISAVHAAPATSTP